MAKPRTKVHRRQYPLTAGYAFTDHMAQGQTTEPVVVDIGPLPVNLDMTSFSAYVTVSRSQEGVFDSEGLRRRDLYAENIWAEVTRVVGWRDQNKMRCGVLPVVATSSCPPFIIRNISFYLSESIRSQQRKKITQRSKKSRDTPNRDYTY